MYDTNGLTLNDLYPYGQEHGDAVRTNGDLPIAPLLEPINNIIGLESHNPTATRYQVSIMMKSSVWHMHMSIIHVLFLI